MLKDVNHKEEGSHKEEVGVKMVDYKIVKYCRLCKERFVVPKGQSKQYHCDKCQKMIDKEQEEEK
jgi:hypothetical protein